jgi:hypothetical protein
MWTHLQTSATDASGMSHSNAWPGTASNIYKNFKCKGNFPTYSRLNCQNSPSQKHHTGRSDLMFPDYVVQMKCQEMSYAVTYSTVRKGRNFRHMAFVGLNLSEFSSPTYCGGCTNMMALYSENPPSSMYLEMYSVRIFA